MELLLIVGLYYIIQGITIGLSYLVSFVHVWVKDIPPVDTSPENLSMGKMALDTGISKAEFKRNLVAGKYNKDVV